MRNVVGHIEPLRVLDRKGNTSVAIEDSKKIVVFCWKIVDMYGCIFHERSPACMCAMIPFIWQRAYLTYSSSCVVFDLLKLLLEQKVAALFPMTISL